MAGDADHDGAGAGDEVVFRAQLYRRTAIKLHRRAELATSPPALSGPTRVAYRTKCATRALAKPTTRMAAAVTVIKSMVHGWSPSPTRSKCPERLSSRYR